MCGSDNVSEFQNENRQKGFFYNGLLTGSLAADLLNNSPAVTGIMAQTIGNFSPTYFWLLLKDILWAETILDLPAQLRKGPEHASIKYFPRIRLLVLQGLESSVEKAYDMFKNPEALVFIRAREAFKRMSALKINKVLHRAPAACATARSDNNAPVEPPVTLIFSLDSEIDATLIQAWETNVVPALPELLQPTVGDDYSVALLREGPSRKDSNPFVRIQSPNKPCSRNQQCIQKDIWTLLTNYQGALPVVKFYKGKTLDLVDEVRNLYEDEDEDLEHFPHHKSYWERPGMGGSVGILGDRSLSGTFGGYVVIDQKLHILATYHMVEEARTHVIQTDGSHGPGSVRLTSPSLADVDEVNKFLKHSLRSGDAWIRDILSTGNDYVVPREAESLFNLIAEREFGEDIEVQLTLLEDVVKTSEEYVIGNLVYWKVWPYRQYSGSPFAPAAAESDLNCLRMDWCLFEITNNNRLGQNRHRYRQLPGGNGLDYTAADTTTDTMGLGNLCSQACYLQPGSPAHYVGRKSGLRRGRINPTREVVSIGGRVTREWCFIIEGRRLSGEDLTGDSGAWILKDGSNEAMAMIHASGSNGPLVTPLLDIFQDIRDVTGASDVHVPRPPPGPQASNLCEFANKEKQAKRYDVKTLPKPSRLRLRLMLKRGVEEINLLHPKDESPRLPNLTSPTSSSNSDSGYSVATPSDGTTEYATPLDGTTEYASNISLPIRTKNITSAPIRTLEEVQAQEPVYAIATS
ncbi:MAG: hypothetical protein LQ340_000298 [Diploschistes diacapsis]|nr:MAG: hypothetical protein LQ340_000298 [Diploschistes diacapsis]